VASQTYGSATGTLIADAAEEGSPGVQWTLTLAEWLRDMATIMEHNSPVLCLSIPHVSG